jgi:phosphatidylinositol kinase/protein kinase (PI-3  family)
MTELTALALQGGIVLAVVTVAGAIIRRNNKVRSILSDGFFHHSNREHQLRSDTMTLRNDLLVKAEAVKKAQIENPMLSVRQALEEINEQLRGARK